ncbi:MAG TPA: class I SAM-dependent methyltransferase [Stellaceae bacterium]|nr:class I SAM-dependent methyltransferase [Stellaceae bacterium]
MAETQIRFEDGAGYERMMGVWSRLAGNIFIDWVAPSAGLKWIDVGCGNGAFTELLIERCAPAEVQGIDPSEAQLAFARGRPAARMADFHKGDAMALPFSENRFDAAAMALVIFFVPTPAKGIAEMARVVSPGGTVAAYAWDILGGGFPLEPVRAEMRAMGLQPANPPSVSAAALDALQELWTRAGLRDVATREISVERTFADFDDFWATSLLSASLGSAIAGMPTADRERLKAGVRARLTADTAGRITFGARANAVKGRVPG